MKKYLLMVAVAMMAAVSVKAQHREEPTEKVAPFRALVT